MSYETQLTAASPQRAPQETDEAPDMTNQYNTKLSDKDEKDYQSWATKNNRQNDTYDYDMRGAWKEGVQQGDSGHFPDTYKKPNHPTFSDESKYHGTDGHEGGKWSKQDGKDRFDPGPTNMHSKPALKRYFEQVEPDAVLGDKP